MGTFRGFIDAMSLSGAVILILFSLTCAGLAMDWAGKPNGEKVWSNFGSALLSFATGRYIASGKKEEPKDDPPSRP